MNDFFWLPDGRLLYLVPEPESLEGSLCNFWEMPLDKHTGQPIAKPRRLTNWSGYCMSSLSATATGKTLAFLKSAGKETAFLAELAAAGTRIIKPRHFPLTENSEGVVDWTPDSQAIFFMSDRSGHRGITDKLSTRTSPNQSSSKAMAETPVLLPMARTSSIWG